jgi:hypothetical protein
MGRAERRIALKGESSMETASVAAVQTRNAKRGRWVTANGLRMHYLE